MKVLYDWCIKSEDFDQLELTKVKVMVSFFLFAAFLCLSLVPLTGVINSDFPLLLVAFIFIALLFLFKWTQSIDLVSNLFIGVVFFSTAQLSFSTGGLYSEDAHFLWSVCIIGFVIGNIQSGIVWTSGVLVWYVYLYFLSKNTFWNEKFLAARNNFPPEYYFIVCLIAAALCIGLVLILLKQNKYLVNKLNQRNGNLEEAYKELEEKSNQLKLAYEELNISNEKLEHYAHRVSHDLKEPLRTIISFNGIIAREISKKGANDEKLDKYLDFVQTASTKMNEQISDILNFAKINSQDAAYVETDVNVIVDKVLLLLNKQLKDTRAIIEKGKHPTLFLQPGNIAQIFQNLISNAVKFKHADRPLRVYISSYENHTHWFFSVKDNGIGIPQDKQASIFNEFVKLNADKEGQGIGLATCLQITQHYGGEMKVHSHFGEGSEFVFSLAKANVQAQQTKASNLKSSV